MVSSALSCYTNGLQRVLELLYFLSLEVFIPPFLGLSFSLTFKELFSVTSEIPYAVSSSAQFTWLAGVIFLNVFFF